jgi:hypothetical protein
MAVTVQCDALPHVMGGRLMDRPLFLRLREHMPLIWRRHSAKLVYSLSVHGKLLASLFEKSVPNYPHILVIKTANKLFGAVLSDPLVHKSIHDGFYGKPSTFVFNGMTNEVYKMKRNSRFISVSEKTVQIGSPRAAVFIQDGMERVISEYCETFESPPFVDGDGGECVLDVEYYSVNS